MAPTTDDMMLCECPMPGVVGKAADSRWACPVPGMNGLVKKDEAGCHRLTRNACVATPQRNAFASFGLVVCITCFVMVKLLCSLPFKARPCCHQIAQALMLDLAARNLHEP